MAFKLLKTFATKRKIRFAILLLLLFLVPGVAGATIYECRMPDGILFLTNNQDKIPADCEQIGVSVPERADQPAASSSVTDANAGGANSRQANSTPAPHSRVERPERTTPPVPAEKSGKSHQVEFNDIQRTAQFLADRYKMVQESPMSPSEKSAELEKLEKYFSAIRQSLDANNIEGEDREKIEAMLSSL